MSVATEIAAAIAPPRPSRIRAFEATEYAERALKLRRAMNATGIDLLILSSPVAMCWLHGYSCRWYNGNATSLWPPLACTAIHVDHEAFITFEVSSHAELIAHTSVSEDNRFFGEDSSTDRGHAFILSELRAEGWLRGRVGLEMEAHRPNPRVSRLLEAALRDARMTVLDATRLIRGVQRVKSPAELEKIREAARINDVGLRRLQEVAHPEMTGLEAWGEMMLAMAREGGEHAGIHEVVDGDLTVGGHEMSSRLPLGTGAFGADPCGVKHRYHANICRSFWIGDPPDVVVEHMKIVGGAYDVLTAAARPGVTVNEVNMRLREYYEHHDIWDMRRWVGGYELGISFPPDWVGEFVFTIEDDEPGKAFEHGMVTNFESVFSLGMIDTVLYLDEGTEVLSTMPLDLIVL